MFFVVVLLTISTQPHTTLTINQATMASTPSKCYCFNSIYLGKTDPVWSVYDSGLYNECYNTVAVLSPHIEPLSIPLVKILNAFFDKIEGCKIVGMMNCEKGETGYIFFTIPSNSTVFGDNIATTSKLCDLLDVVEWGITKGSVPPGTITGLFSSKITLIYTGLKSFVRHLCNQDPNNVLVARSEWIAVDDALGLLTLCEQRERRLADKENDVHEEEGDAYMNYRFQLFYQV